MNYEKAKSNALKINPKFNSVFDYGDAWVFSIKGSMSIDNSPVAILKQSGKVLQFSQYLMTRNTNASPTSIPF